ncbi:MAG: purine-nucleoside phosphorylase [Lachnospiraceae bacterium]|jgi:purine-nucleoside phosphorylase|nr:purine-nucleoside phosphorylase [Lachnospiraceae bacterium]
MRKEIAEMAAAVRKVTDFQPKVALTLGSGLGNFADTMKVEAEISYKDIPGFPVSTAPGHEGKLLFGYVEDVPVVCMKGRVHYYEGYPIDKVVTPVRLCHALGAKIMFLTNAAGGAKESYHPGTLALVTDHISVFVPNPLIGPNDDEEGVRFPDMTNVYDKGLQEIIQKTAQKENIPLDTGVYVQLTGPSFETPSEIKMLHALGANLFGMSTVVEAITARHCGMKVCCISLVSNMAAGITGAPLTSEEVIEAGNQAASNFTRLVRSSIEEMGEE